MADGSLSEILNQGPLTLQQWNAGVLPDGQAIPVGAMFVVMTSDGPVNLRYTGTGDTGGGGGSTRPMEDSGDGEGGNTTPPPITPNPLGVSPNGLPWFPHTYGLGPGMYASLQDQISAAATRRDSRNPFATQFERFQFSRGTPADETTWAGWGKAPPNTQYPIPPQYTPPPITAPGGGQGPLPGTNTPGQIGGGGQPNPTNADLQRNSGLIPAPRGGQLPVGQQPAMRGSPNNPGGLLGQPAPTPVSAAGGRGAPISEIPAMRTRPGSGLLTIAANAEDAPMRGKAAAVPSAAVPANNAGMSPMGAAAGQDAFRFGNTANPAAANYNALAGVSPQLAQQFLSVGGGGVRSQLYNEAAPGKAQGLLNAASPVGGGFTGNALAQQIAAAIPGFAGSPMAAALAKQGSGGFTGYLTPAQAAALGLQANTFGGALPNSNFYTVPLAK